mmetsp:Transcript_75611/g.245849  ORF Transcript_75611/g.245849 Transcript_75611/m.245849 type:complete len:207 (+) Transcript_75611:64-684(+)
MEAGQGQGDISGRTHRTREVPTAASGSDVRRAVADAEDAGSHTGSLISTPAARSRASSVAEWYGTPEPRLQRRTWSSWMLNGSPAPPGTTPNTVEFDINDTPRDTGSPQRHGDLPPALMLPGNSSLVGGEESPCGAAPRELARESTGPSPGGERSSPLLATGGRATFWRSRRRLVLVLGIAFALTVIALVIVIVIFFGYSTSSSRV